MYHLAAELVLIIHLGFVLFVVLGALLAIRWHGLTYLHIPAALWAGFVELSGMTCPLTPLEVELRQLGGEAGYRGGFIDHYIVAALYPSDLTREMQVVLGVLALAPNALVYAWLFGRRKRQDSA